MADSVGLIRFIKIKILKFIRKSSNYQSVKSTKTGVKVRQRSFGNNSSNVHISTGNNSISSVGNGNVISVNGKTYTDDVVTVNGVILKPGTPEYIAAKKRINKNMEILDENMEQMSKNLRNMFK